MTPWAPYFALQLLAAAWLSLSIAVDRPASPAEYGALGVVVILISAGVKLYANDRRDARSHEKELRDDLDERDATIERERSAKHRALNDLAICRGERRWVRRLASKCTCGALADLPAFQELDGIEQPGT
jgi:hypothetical protein